MIGLSDLLLIFVSLPKALYPTWTIRQASVGSRSKQVCAAQSDLYTTCSCGVRAFWASLILCVRFSGTISPYSLIQRFLRGLVGGIDSTFTVEVELASTVVVDHTSTVGTEFTSAVEVGSNSTSAISLEAKSLNPASTGEAGVFVSLGRWATDSGNNRTPSLLKPKKPRSGKVDGSERISSSSALRSVSDSFRNALRDM